MEIQLSDMEEEKDDVEQSLEFTEDKLRKAIAQAEQAQNELQMERSSAQKAENARAQLDRQVRGDGVLLINWIFFSKTGPLDK